MYIWTDADCNELGKLILLSIVYKLIYYKHGIAILGIEPPRMTVV